jgi:hypothetical protein
MIFTLALDPVSKETVWEQEIHPIKEFKKIKMLPWIQNTATRWWLSVGLSLAL